MNLPRLKTPSNGIARAEPLLRLHASLDCSFANGPGARAVIWTQGCTLGCRGCFNPDSHTASGGVLTPVSKILEWLLGLRGIEGITLSGGEPFEQAHAVLELCREIRRRSRLSIICFSGFTLRELRRVPGWDSELMDVLIAGRYDGARRVARSLTGSSNKRFHFFSDRYGPRDFQDIPESEAFIDANGDLIISGIEPLRTSAFA